MIGTAQMLERAGCLDGENLEHLRQISVQGERATRLVDQILDFSRATAVERKPLDLVPFLSQIVRMVRRTLPETITLEESIDLEQCVVDANLSQLQQTVMNLVANAADAMPDGGRIEIRLADMNVSGGDGGSSEPAPGEYAVIAVSDTGRGMSDDVKAHVFEPFYTTKAPGQGTGLGLAQVYGIVMQHGGHVEIESDVGQGTTITIYLPKSVKRVQRASVEDEEMPMGHRETVLLVEDEEPVRDAVQAMLEALDYHVLPASDGREALSVFGGRKDEIDAVLTDIVMPEMGGLELWAALRVRKDVPVIAMSGYPLGTFEGDEEGSTLPEEISAYLKKPVVLQQLAQALRRALHPETN
jgi:two-component system cell cycle sensor histidine kinase/response regulator CckA